jgi:hypothetical protein
VWDTLLPSVNLSSRPEPSLHREERPMIYRDDIEAEVEDGELEVELPRGIELEGEVEPPGD